jgi:glycosyltransferase involved in cell wall biosynthesis
VHVLPPNRTIITCHDLDAFRSVVDPLRHPRSRFYRAMAQRMLAGFAKAARVTCDSATVHDELLSYGLVPPDRLVVAPIGVHPSCTPQPQPAADAEASRLLGCARPDSVDLLHVGSTIHRKRIDILLRVFAAVHSHFPSARLIRVGGPLTPAQISLAEQLGIHDSLVSLPLLDRNVLAAVYRRATLVLQPSDAEGFGLPVVEAMACGTPVVASEIAVLKEVGGDAATYCPVGDVLVWQQRVCDLLMERSFDDERWSARRAKGISHASRFGWEAYAATMVSLYQDVLRA